MAQQQNFNDPRQLTIPLNIPNIPNNNPMAWGVNNVNLQAGNDIPLQFGNIINIMNSKSNDLPNISILEAYLLINKNYFSPVSPDYLNNPLPQNNNGGDQTPPPNNQQPAHNIQQHRELLNTILDGNDQIRNPNGDNYEYNDQRFQYNDENDGFDPIEGDDPNPGLNIGNINGDINGERTLLIPFYDDSRLSYLNRMCKEFKEQLELNLYNNSFLPIVRQFEAIAEQQNILNPITYEFYDDNNQAVRDFYTNNRKTIIACIFLSFITDTPYYWGSTEFTNFNNVYNDFFRNLLSLIEFNAPSYTTLSFFYSTQENGTVIEKIEEFINNNNFNRIFLEEIIPSYLTELFHFSERTVDYDNETRMYTFNNPNNNPLTEMYVYRPLFCQLIYNYLYNNVFHGNNLNLDIPNYDTFIFEENSYIPPRYTILWINPPQQQPPQQPVQPPPQQQPLQPPLNILQHIASTNVLHRPVNRPLHMFDSPPPVTNDNRSPRDILFIRQPNDTGDNIPNNILTTGSPITSGLGGANIVKSPGYFDPQNGQPIVSGEKQLFNDNELDFQQQQYKQFVEMYNNINKITYFVARYNVPPNFNAINFDNFQILSPQGFYLGYTVRYTNINQTNGNQMDLDSSSGTSSAVTSSTETSPEKKARTDIYNNDGRVNLVDFFAGKTRKHKRKHTIKKKTRKHKRKHTIKKKTRKHHHRRKTIKKKTKKNSKV